MYIRIVKGTLLQIVLSVVIFLFEVSLINLQCFSIIHLCEMFVIILQFVLSVFFVYFAVSLINLQCLSIIHLCEMFVIILQFVFLQLFFNL